MHAHRSSSPQGIDAGGLTREWYSILAKEIFNANYALFKAGADGVTYQPNPLSQINPDHLAYFKFVVSAAILRIHSSTQHGACNPHIEYVHT